MHPINVLTLSISFLCNILLWLGVHVHVSFSGQTSQRPAYCFLDFDLGTMQMIEKQQISKHSQFDLLNNGKYLIMQNNNNNTNDNENKNDNNNNKRNDRRKHR